MLMKLIGCLMALASKSVVQGKDLREKPLLKDWLEATWFDGTVQIPITLDRVTKSLWMADLVIISEKTH